MLSENEKKRIEEEESYRSNLRNKNAPKKNHRLLWLGLIVIVLVFAGMVINSWNKAGTNTAATEAAKGQLLNAEMGAADIGIAVKNLDTATWTGCTVTLNNFYTYQSDIKPGQNLFQYSQFVKNGDQKFNYVTTKPTMVEVQCENPKASGVMPLN